MMKKILFLIPILYSFSGHATSHHFCIDKEGRQLILMQDDTHKTVGFMVQGTTGLHAGTLTQLKEGTYRGYNKATGGKFAAYTLNLQGKKEAWDALFNIEGETGEKEIYTYTCKDHTAEMQKAFDKMSKK